MLAHYSGLLAIILAVFTIITKEVQNHENVEVSISGFGDLAFICYGLRELNRTNKRINNHNLYPEVPGRRRHASPRCDEGHSATGYDQ